MISHIQRHRKDESRSQGLVEGRVVFTFSLIENLEELVEGIHAETGVHYYNSQGGQI